MLRNILFDLGNVLVDIDFPASEQALRSIPGLNTEAFDALIDKHQWFNRYECGEMTEESFVNAIQRCYKPVPEGMTIIRSINAMLHGIPQARLTALSSLRKNYKLYVLSNTNETHLRWIQRHLIQMHGITDFETAYFDKVFYSHQVGKRKPDIEIFRHVLNTAGIKAEETLFIDDNYDNIHSSKQLGFHVHHHDPSIEIFDILPDLIKSVPE